MTNYPVLITGANRGLGLEMVRTYLKDGRSVLATCRNPQQATRLSALQEQYTGRLDIFELDVADPLQRLALTEKLGDTALDIFISNAGVYGGHQQNFGEIDEQIWLETLKVNTIAPLMLSQLLVPNLLNGQLKTIAMLSSKMGSIDDNEYGKSYIYRSSKTALNSIVRSMSIDLKQQGFRILAMHPGWVKTDMGGESGLIDVEQSVAGMRQIIDRKELADSGRFFAYDGIEIPW